MAPILWKLLVTVCGDKSGSEVKETQGRCLPLKIVRETVQEGRTYGNETKTKVVQMEGHVR